MASLRYLGFNEADRGVIVLEHIVVWSFAIFFFFNRLHGSGGLFFFSRFNSRLNWSDELFCRLFFGFKMTVRRLDWFLRRRAF